MAPVFPLEKNCCFGLVGDDVGWLGDPWANFLLGMVLWMCQWTQLLWAKQELFRCSSQAWLGCLLTFDSILTLSMSPELDTHYLRMIKGANASLTTETILIEPAICSCTTGFGMFRLVTMPDIILILRFKLFFLGFKLFLIFLIQMLNIPLKICRFQTFYQQFCCFLKWSLREGFQKK